MIRTLPFLALIALPTLAPAHFLWATLDPAGKTVAIAFQEVPTDAPLPMAERAAKVKAWASTTEPFVLKADANRLLAPAGDRAAASLDYGVLDKTAQGRGRFWLKYYAKAAANPEASARSLGLPLELSAARKDGTWVVTVLKDGKPAAGAELTASVPGEPEPFVGKTGADGTLSLPAFEGPLAARAAVVENVKGTQGGHPYDLVRLYSTLTVRPKPFSRVLHDSFGDNHDVVSHTAFIETVMAGKLTKAGLIEHLQQRELVHEAVARILDGAPNVPYGADQRNVLAFLKADLAALGSTTPATPKPVTQAFLDEVAASAKTGPWFALGVLHVYYGGITNGGRDVGAMMADQTGFQPAYYLKSDGYPAYVRTLNALTLAPDAQKEAIRGGQAAYRYIIAVNGETPKG